MQMNNPPWPADIATMTRAAQQGDPNAAFDLGLHHAGRAEFHNAREWFDRADAAGHPRAPTELALFALYGCGRAPNAVDAEHLLARADARGDVEAPYRLASLILGNVVLRFDADRCLDHLLRASERGFIPAQRAIAMAWAAQGDTDAASACLAPALAAGDGMAAFLTARLSASADRARALDDFALGQGIGRAAAFGAVPSPRLPQLAPSHWPGRPGVRWLAASTSPATVLKDRPLLAIHDDVFNALECEYIIASAADKVKPSMVFDPATGQRVVHWTRTSSSITMPAHDDDVCLRVMQRRLATLARFPLSHAEPFDILRYQQGQQYGEHWDYLFENGEPARLPANTPGQRARTTFSYLTTVASGGETNFPRLGQRVPAQRGRVVVFDNLMPDGTPDTDTLHAGLPVAAGEKWLATLWLRERAMRAY